MILRYLRSLAIAANRKMMQNTNKMPQISRAIEPIIARRANVELSNVPVLTWLMTWKGLKSKGCLKNMKSQNEITPKSIAIPAQVHSLVKVLLL